MKTLDEFLKMCFWEVLGLQRGEADPAVIQRAFRKMSLRYHPDKGGDTTTFVFLSMVAEVLGNPQKRRLYEAFGGGFLHRTLPERRATETPPHADTTHQSCVP